MLETPFSQTFGVFESEIVVHSMYDIFIPACARCLWYSRIQVNIPDVYTWIFWIWIHRQSFGIFAGYAEFRLQEAAPFGTLAIGSSSFSLSIS